MKKKYEAPTIEVIPLEFEDIITSSTGYDCPESEEGHHDHGNHNGHNNPHNPHYPGDP